MDLVHIITMICTVFASLGAVFTLWTRYVRLETRMAILWKQYEKKTATLQDNQDNIVGFLIDRARVAAKNKGFMEENSPLMVAKKARLFYEPILRDLRNFHQKIGCYLTEKEEFLLIQKNWGRWISENICLKSEPVMDMGECILIALELAKEQEDETR